MNKRNLAILALVFLFGLAIVLIGSLGGEKDSMSSLVEFLDKNEVVIYGSESCPACSNLVEAFGGYDIIDPIYVECTEEKKKCKENIQGKYIPEIQINGEVYEGKKKPQNIADEVGCEFNE